MTDEVEAIHHNPYKCYSKPPSLSSSGQDSAVTATQRVPWITRLIHWFITIDQLPQALEDEKNYGSIAHVTNYMFLFGGRMRTVARSKHQQLLVLGCIVLPITVFSIFEARALWHTSHALRVLVMLLYYSWLICLHSFIKTATSDPGLLPRNIHLPQASDGYKIPNEYYNTITLPSPTTAAPVVIKYCSTCRIWRPPRASHCSTCNACIMTFDHHCGWVNNCIGQRNYRFFVTFLFSVTMSSVFLVIACAARLRHRTNLTTRHKAVNIALLCFASLVIWYPMVLAIYHIFLAGTQQTTHEYLRSIDSGNPMFHRIVRVRSNPYLTKSFKRNMVLLICQPRGPNILNPRTRHTPGDWRFVPTARRPSFEKL